MQATIYIRPDDEEAWKAIDNKSQWVHEGLAKKISPVATQHIHIDSTPVSENAFHRFVADKVSSPVRPDNGKDPRLDTPYQDMKEFDDAVEAGKPELPKCCSLKTPCKHWVIDPLRDGRVNTLSGEFKPYEI